MVYSSVPLDIDCFSGGVPGGEDDSMSSFWSSEVSNDSSSFDSEPERSMIENWDPFEQGQPAFSTNPTRYQDLVKVPKPTMLLPPLEDLKYPEDGEDEPGEGGVACVPHCMSNLSRLSPFGRGVSARARVEMLQHQLGKPFRKLSVGKRIVARAGALDCFKEKDEEKTTGSQGETEDAGSSNNSAQSRNQRPSREDPDGAHRDAVNDNFCDFDPRGWWKDVKDEGLAPRPEGRNVRFLYSCDLWPVDASTSADPPGHYYQTKPAVEFHFYNDFSVEAIQTFDFEAPAERPFIEQGPTTTPTEYDDDDETSASGSAFVLQVGLD